MKKTTQHNKEPNSHKASVHLLLLASILASLAGFAAFIILIIPDFDIYMFIITPIILAFYQAPAAYLFWLWKKKTNRLIPDPKSDEEQELKKKEEKK